MQSVKDRVEQEMRKVRAKYPNATEHELVQKLEQMGAHPQTVAIQRARARRDQVSRIPKIVITPPDHDPDQPRRSTRKTNPLDVPISSNSQQFLQVPSASSTRRSTSVSRPSRIPVPVNRAVPRTSSGIKQEVTQSLKNESAALQQMRTPISGTPRKSVCKSHQSRTSPTEQRQRTPSPTQAQDALYMTPTSEPYMVKNSRRRREKRQPVPRRLVARRLFDDIEDEHRPQRTPQADISEIRRLRCRPAYKLSPVPEDQLHWESMLVGNADDSSRLSSKIGLQSVEDPGISILKDAGALSPAFIPEWSFSEVQDMIDDEKKEIRNMQAVVSQLLEPARQVQFKDMYSLVPHIFLDETETSPEVAAAILHSDEKGLSLKTTPAKLYDTLFQGGEADRTVMKVNAPSSHSKAGVLVPLSSQGVEASFIGYEPAGLYEVIPREGESKMPSPSKREGAEIGSVRDNLGFSVSKGSQVSVSSEDGQFKIILQPDIPKESDFIQIRGSQPPPWFPGYYSMMTDNIAINVTDKPWSVLERAWREFVPHKINSDTGKVIVGS